MEALITFIVWGVIISKIIKSAKGEGKNPVQRKMAEYQERQQRMMRQRTAPQTATQRDAYYYNQQKNMKARLQQQYGVQQASNAKTDILSKARENVKETVQDAVLQQTHAEVCRDYRENGNVTMHVDTHKAVSEYCDTGEESDIIKKVNDLIVTGYSGDMTFERDFIAEGIDILNRFTV